MSYVQTVLADKPAGFWMITAPSGTSETDLSGNGKTATITEATDLIDRGYRPLVTGTSTDIAYRFYSTNHKLSYPTMEAWEKNREHIPFSVEFTFQPVDCTEEAVLFAPQAASSAYVMDNGIYCINNTLRFVVSNGSDTTPATSKAVVQKYLEPGRTYHVVAVYDVSKIKLYVDNVLVDSAEVPPGTGWSHTTANFVTMSNRVTTDTNKAEFILDGVSFYRQALSPESINNHCFMSTPNNSDVDLVNSLGGKIIKINDEDRVKLFNWSGASQGWNSDSIELTDCIINNDGSVGLKKIPPVELRATPQYYGNMLSWDEATTENGTIPGTITPFNCTIQASTLYAAHGRWSVELTGTSASTNLIQKGYMQVEPNTTYTITAEVYSPAATGSQLAKAAVTLYNSAYTQTSYTGAANISTVVDTWSKVTYTFTTGANDRYATPQIWVVAGVIGNKNYIDKFCMTRGSNTAWVAPRVSPALYSSGNFNTNLVGGYFASGRGAGPWITYNAHPAPTQQTTYILSGNSAAQLTTNSTGDVLFGAAPSTGTTGFFRVTPGKTYTVMGSCYAPESSKNFNARIRWHTASGTYINYTAPTAIPTVANSWVTSIGQLTPPAGAAYATIAAWIQAPSNGVTYRFDNFGIFEGTVASWSEPVFNINEIDLSDSRYVLVRDAGKHIGKNSGGFGFFADFTATENDHVGEQALASISNTAGDSVIEIVKKSDKALYLRYKYLNTAGDLTTTEASWGAISSLLATNAYIYVEWGNGLLSLYVNSTTSPAQIAFDNGVKAPRFDENSYLHLGAGADALRPWNNEFKWLKLYNSLQDPSMFILNQTSVNGFTVKLANSLSVSQSGKVQITALTGSDGTEQIDKSRISWSPQNSNISVASGTIDRVNLLTYNQATVETDTTGLTGFGTGTVARTTAIKKSGAASLQVTASSTNLTFGVNNTVGNRIEGIKPGVTYTAHAYSRAATTGQQFRVTLSWQNSAGTWISDSAGSLTTNTTNSWTQHTVTAVAPANATSCYVSVRSTAAVNGQIYYADELGLWEGTSTTWTPPLRAAVPGYQSQYLERFVNEPVQYLVDATLSTDDSYYSPIKLDDLKIEDFADSTQYAENGFDELVYYDGNHVINNNLEQSLRQNLLSGGLVSAGGFYVRPINDTVNTTIPSGGSGATTAGPASQIRTLEFWLYPTSQGYYQYHTGATEYSLRYYDSGGFLRVGWTTLYVDGVSQANGNTLAGVWYNRWHHIVLTNASAQVNIDTDVPSGINLLSVNQATANTDTTGVLIGQGTGTVARVTTGQSDPFFRGTMTTAPGPFAIITPTGLSGIPVSPGKIYSGHARVKSSWVSTANLRVFWYDQAGVNISNEIILPNLTTSTSWQTLAGTFSAAPANAAFASFWVRMAGGGVNGDTLDVDNLGFWEGTSTRWAVPGETAPKNLLHPNVSVGGDQLASTLGFQTHSSTMTYDTTRAFLGAGSIKSAAVSQRHSISTTPSMTQVTPGKTYTAQAMVYPGASPTGGFGWAIYIEWRDTNGITLSQALSSVTLTQDIWNLMTVTGVAPADAAQCIVLVYRNAFAGGTQEDAWIDNLGIWEGTATTWSPSDAKMNFGVPLVGGTQSTARYQNISYYPQSFTAEQAVANYKAYLGDVTAGSFSDAPGSRTLTDERPKYYSNLWNSQTISV